MSAYPPGALIGGRFEVAGRPLMGGQGIVYLCVDRHEQRPVALKTFRPELLPDRMARDRFLRDGTHWVDLGAHPHIVRCYEVLRVGDGTEVYLVLELVAKEQGRSDASLRSWLAPGRPLPAETALLFALQAAQGMAHAVATIPGFVHRDLKPENLLVGADRLTQAPVNRLRVTDLGLVRALSAGDVVSAVGEEGSLPARPGLTRAGRILGTPPYMAPEQWDGPDVDLRADIYALGCILGEMLSGRMLVWGSTLQECRQAHQRGRAAETTRDLPGSLAGVLVRCLAVDPAARYASWGEVEVALAATYWSVVGREAPAPEPAAALGRGERVFTGWSYSEIGWAYLDLGQIHRAMGYFERVRAVAVAEGERWLESVALLYLGVACAALGDIRRAVGYYEQALAIQGEMRQASRGATEWALARLGEKTTLGNLGNAYLQLGDARRAVGYYEQVLAIEREIRDRPAEGQTLFNLGSAYLQQGDARRAIGYLEQYLAMAREIGDRRGEGVALGTLGLAYDHLGDARSAIAHHEKRLAITREIGDRAGEGVALGNLASAYLDLGDGRCAISYCEQALVISREIGDRHGEGALLGSLGSAYLRLADASRAIGCYEQQMVIAHEICDRRGEGNALSGLGCAYLDLGDARRALDCLNQELAIVREIGDRRGEGSALGHLGIAHRRLGDTQRLSGTTSSSWPSPVSSATGVEKHRVAGTWAACTACKAIWQGRSN